MKPFVGSGLVAGMLVVASLGAATAADARVRREGDWPDADKAVTLDVDGAPRVQALRRLADEAGWSLVVNARPQGDPVDIHVKAQPAAKVLERLLDDGDYVAKRDGMLVAIDRDTAPAASAAAAAPSSSGIEIRLGKTPGVEAPRGRGQDRTVMGGDVRVEKGETARDVTVFGGSVDVEGEATGDVTVFGGSVHVHPGGEVHGDATVFGGTLTLDEGARVDGDINALGGELERAPGSTVGGTVSVKGGKGEASGTAQTPTAHPSVFAYALSSFASGVRLAAVMFVIGTVLLALAGRRMDSLRTEIAVRPMRSIALGVLGGFAAMLVLIALCVTIIGIPFAIVVAILGAFAVLAAMCAVLSVVGEGLLRHKTENPYVHLAVGCALFVGLAWIPWVGGLVVAAVVLAGVGVLVATRVAGFVVRKNGNGNGGGPYRTAGSAP